MGGPPITLLKRGSLVARMGEKQSDLDKLVPISYIMEWIGKQLDNKAPTTMSERVIVLLSKTGSGKSSSIAPSIYLRYFKSKYRNKQIVITQPRVLTCIEIPKDIAKIDAYKKPTKDGLTIELYRNMGHQTQEFVAKPTEKGILFCTTGILLQFLKNMSDERFIKKYRFIIIDEAHDRSLDVDLVLLMMRNLIKRNLSKDPPFLILMSATLNVPQYSKYFNTKTVFEVNGMSKPIAVHYPPADVSDIFAKTCEIVKGLGQYDKDGEPRDMIIFMPAPGAISTMISRLKKLNPDLKKKILPVPITSADINGGTENLRLIMADPDTLRVDIDGKSVPIYRRIIVSTNVAETGLTLESLRYCIDTGFQFTSEFNPRYGLRIMTTKPTTSSMSLQRKGRVGRKSEGVFFPLYSENTFNKMIVMNTPSIAVEEMTSHMLALIANTPVIDINKLPVYQMLTPPSPDSVDYSLERLFTLGAIDASGNITKLGAMMSSFRKISAESCRMILSGLVRGASLKELVCLACLLTKKRKEIVLPKMESGVEPYTTGLLFDELYEMNPTFEREKCDMRKYSSLKAKLLVGCEMLEILLIYQRFSAKAGTLSIVELKRWCEGKGLSYYTLCRVTEMINEVYWQMLETHKINPLAMETQYGELYQTLKRSRDADNTDLVDAAIRLKQCIYDGYKNNLITWSDEHGAFMTDRGLRVVVKSPLASKLAYQKAGAAFEQEMPKQLIYHELMMMQGRDGQFTAEAKNVSVVDGFVTIDAGFSAL